MRRKLLVAFLLIFILVFGVACKDKKDDVETGNNADTNIEDNVDDEDNIDVDDENAEDDSSSEDADLDDEELTDEPIADDVFVDEGPDESEGEDELEEEVFGHIYTYEILSKVMYARTEVNVRTLPSTQGEILGQLQVNDEINITGKVLETGWYRVEFKDQVAYVHYDYLVDTPIPVKEPEKTEEAAEVENLEAASFTNQIIIVAATGNQATVSMYEKTNNGK